MFDTLIYYTLIILFVYTAIFTVYYSLVVFMSINKNKIKNSPQYMTTSYNNNIIVVIYAHNNEKTVVPLLEQLNKQNYPNSNYQVHIILDNCTDTSANKLEFIGGAKIWRLNDNGAPQGKDETISWLLERLLTFKNVNAFVFLDANRLVDTNFLSEINNALLDENVIIGSTEVILEDNSFKSAMLAKINEYKCNIIETGRSVLGLATKIDSDVIAMKYEVLEKIKCVDFKDSDGELKYTVLLSRNNFIPKFKPSVKTMISSESFSMKKSSFKFKSSLFSHCLKLFFSSNFKFAEFITSLFAPAPVFLISVLAILEFITLNYNFTESANEASSLFGPAAITVTAVITILTIAFLASLTQIKRDKNNLKYLFTYPLYCFYKKRIKNAWWYKLYQKAFNNEEYVNVEKATIPIMITDGKRTIPCKLDLISEDGLVRVIFKHKNKKYTTDSHIRMCDAIKSISDKLYERGLRIKICQSCAYFKAKIDGTTNMLKGFCNKQVVTEQLVEPSETLLWNTCEFYLPEDLNKIIDLSSYKKKS